MSHGIVKNGFDDRGFTFIRCEELPHLFLHITDIAEGENAELFVEGAGVTFEVKTIEDRGESKTRATNARIDGSSTFEQQEVDTDLIAKDMVGRVKFWNDLAWGFIRDEATGSEYFSHSSSVQDGYLRPGDILQFDVVTADSQVRAVNVRKQGWNYTGDSYYDELDFGHPKWVGRLAGLAEDEDWNYREMPHKDRLIILRQYVKYTYLRQRELPGHLVESRDGRFMAFNTGLVTGFQEEIFAWFNRHALPGDQPKWKLHDFKRASDTAFLSTFGGDVPPLAVYYERPAGCREIGLVGV